MNSRALDPLWPSNLVTEGRPILWVSFPLFRPLSYNNTVKEGLTQGKKTFSLERSSPCPFPVDPIPVFNTFPFQTPLFKRETALNFSSVAWERRGREKIIQRNWKGKKEDIPKRKWILKETSIKVRCWQESPSFLFPRSRVVGLMPLPLMYTLGLQWVAGKRQSLELSIEVRVHGQHTYISD